jgi:glycosyltransferase involved in cell wall biosynthesis
MENNSTANNASLNGIVISVIIPFYNVEKYLARCLDSVLGQTFKDYEIIVINDGSTDDSAKILADYALQDHRIKIINQTNQGQSVARNNGLKAAQGKYIYFLDSDDFIHPQLLEICYQFITKHNADWVTFQYDKKFRRDSRHYEARGTEATQKVYKKYSDFSKIPFKITNNPLQFFGKKFGYKATNYVWERLYKRDLLKDAQFIPNINSSDTAFIINLYKKYPKTIFLKEPLYYYAHNPQSISNTKSKRPKKYIQDMQAVLRSIYETYKNSPEKEFAFVAREIVPKYLKEQLKVIKRAPKAEQAKLYEIFTKELIDFDNKKFIRLKWRRLFTYLKFKRMIKRGLKG